MIDDYADIISHPRHISRNHTPMPMEKRAAQFSPFAALSGYEDAVKETAQLAEEEVLLRDRGTEGYDGES